MEEDNRKCLFCLDKIVSYSLSSGDGADGGNDKDGEASSKPPNFRSLCNLLQILVPDDKRKELKNCVDDDKTCDSFLCLCCFELVDKLRKLNVELERIREEIGLTTGKIRSVIVNQNNGLSASTAGVSDEDSGKRKWDREKKDYCSDGDFFRVFQELVKESVDPPIPGTSLENNPGKLEDDGAEKFSRKSKKARKKTERPKRRKKWKAIEDAHNLEGMNSQSSVEGAHIKIEVHHQPDNMVEDDPYPFSDDFENDAEFPETKPELPFTGEWGAAEESVGDIEYKTSVEGETRKSGIVRRSKRSASSLNATSGNIPPPKRKRDTNSKSSADPDPPQFTCRECDASFKYRRDFVAHQQNHILVDVNSLPIKKLYVKKNGTRKKLWACSLCDHKDAAGKLWRFAEHMLSHDNPAAVDPLELLPCDKCEQKFSLKLNLDLHKIFRHEWRHILLRCEFCQNSDCKTQEDFIAHLKTHLGDDATIHACKSCAMACTSLDKLLDHMKKHSCSKRLICPECPNEYTAVKDVYEHCFEAHPEFKQMFACTLCSKSFLMELSLGIHMKQAHGIGVDPVDQSLPCPKCSNGKMYKSKAHLDRHITNMHGDSESQPHKYKCSQCQKSFKYQSQLRLHIDEKHNKIRHPCPHCPNSYSVAIELTYHMRTHTGEGLYTCDQCGKQFPRKNQLKVHLITHQKKDPEAKFVCEICGKEWKSELHLQRHKANHKEKSLECQYCPMKFRRRDNLKSHLRTHTGDRPYVCPVCQKDFNRRDILFVHMKMHGFSQEEAAKVYDNHVKND